MDIEISTYDKFRKAGFMNRAIIPSSNGLTALSVPIAGGREARQILKDVRIDNSQRWQTRHWRTITSAYRRSPWFEYYEPSLAKFYDTQYDHLFQWNLDLMKWVLKRLNYTGEVHISEKEACRQSGELRPANFQQPEFTSNLARYPQVFEDRIGFQPNVSILDLICNEGNNCRSLL